MHQALHNQVHILPEELSFWIKHQIHSTFPMPIQDSVDVVSEQAIYCFVNSFTKNFAQMAELTLISLDYHSLDER